MMITGVDCHPSVQTIASLVEETGEYGEAERFNRGLSVVVHQAEIRDLLWYTIEKS